MHNIIKRINRITPRLSIIEADKKPKKINRNPARKISNFLIFFAILAIPLLFPNVSMIIIAAHFPESWLICFTQFQLR